MEQRSVVPSTARHCEGSVSEPMEAPSDYEPETREKKGHTNKMPTELYVVQTVGDNGEPLLPIEVNAKAKHACGCLAKGNVRIIHDDWRKVPKIDKDFIWDIWINIFRVPRGTEPKSRRGS